MYLNAWELVKCDNDTHTHRHTQTQNPKHTHTHTNTKDQARRTFQLQVCPPLQLPAPLQVFSGAVTKRQHPHLLLSSPARWRSAMHARARTHNLKHPHTYAHSQTHVQQARMHERHVNMQTVTPTPARTQRHTKRHTEDSPES